MKNRYLFKPPENITFILLIYLFIAFHARADVKYPGVNLAGAAFGDLTGEYGKHYTYPTKQEIDYFTQNGMNTFRLSFKWERIQPTALEEFDQNELKRIQTFVEQATDKQAYTVLDPHNYARYYGDIIGSENVPVAVFQDLWERLANHFKDNPYVIFGLMNEPHDMDTILWLSNANAAIKAIRATGAENLILVPGNGYTGAQSWHSSWYGIPNSAVMNNIIDPMDNYAFEVHTYFDSNSSGTSPSCVDENIGSNRLKTFTKWLKETNQKGFLGEFGVSTDPLCLTVLDDALNHINSNADVWLGWTYWAAGPWWNNYMFSVEPENGEDKPQMSILTKYANANE